MHPDHRGNHQRPRNRYAGNLILESADVDLTQHPDDLELIIDLATVVLGPIPIVIARGAMTPSDTSIGLTVLPVRLDTLRDDIEFRIRAEVSQPLDVPELRARLGLTFANPTAQPFGRTFGQLTTRLNSQGRASTLIPSPWRDATTFDQSRRPDAQTPSDGAQWP